MTIQQAFTLISPAATFLQPSMTDGQPSATDLASGHPTHWADLGCGSGVFTEALARLLPAGSTIHGIDTHPTLRQQTTPNGVRIVPVKADFITDDLALHPLDGILMANSLHYVKDKPGLLKKLQAYMHPGSPFLIVEYDTDRPVPTWVPYPLSYDSLTKLFIGQTHIQKLGEQPSVYGRANLYAALVLHSPATTSSVTRNNSQ